MHHFKKFIFCFLLIPVAFNAQESSYTKDISDYLDGNGTMLQYEYAYGELLKMLSNNFPQNENNAQGWEYLRANKEKALGEMKSLIIPIYKSNFTHNEIKEMSAFYSSEAGLQLISDRSKMTEAHKEVLNTFYNSATGQKIMSKQEVLTMEISKVSESWSRDLYETSISLLNNG
ncbi:MAG: DUF2059 domain-containing protein [Maribacter sp.]|nr:DUF2059 domain-containing protein [Maribacter sp.]